MKNQDRFEELFWELKSMRVSGMAIELKKQMDDPNIGLLSTEERIERLIDAEYESRRNNKIQRLIKKSHLRYAGASINEQMLSASGGMNSDTIIRLSHCDWIDEGRNLLVTGKTGTGKTYCACALALAAINHSKVVCYEKASRLLRTLEQANDSKELNQTLNRYSKYDLLVIDDFGLMSLDSELCRLLFELIDSREGEKSSVIISQLPVSEWYDLFKDVTFADAILDRLTGSAYRLEFEGESLRRNSQTE